ncbi:hypothetical protein BTW15_18245 [Pseudomonas syringae pv. tomato]|uniref:Uncharacterized protein n=1 Tax=Pseudomonas syringae pv. tomato TaxID=323 RepID=A0AB36KPW7_PSEUB|nr:MULTISPECIES: hypothetical protein [Pseudomonas syringae group]MBI6850972.1 hypothetical protein [Pseudomonas syringae]MBX6508914.1 hypothetical protein [Pseudomonas syringae pv. tomato]OPE58719.1 hypothetical protein BTW15_18245 [Pseudomonas syringae pv. tomato]TES57028.1 hypothetical protein E2N91_16975 [Pseudomonas syringae pv. tomato]TES74459.1 hypothetical protein E2N89_24235 [Pseudomonas syringae pv. tomato]
MKRNYQAVFIIPIGASKVLGDDGWEFDSVERLPEGMGEYLAERLKLEFIEAYTGIRRYVNNQINMSISFDSANEVESIYFQAFDNGLVLLSEACKIEEVACHAEIFIPEKQEPSKGTA